MQPDHDAEGDEGDEEDGGEEPGFWEDDGDLDGASGWDGVCVGGECCVAEPAGEAVEPGDADGKDGDGDQRQEIGDEPAELAREVHLWGDGCGEDEIECAVFAFAGDRGGGHVDGDECDQEDFGEDE